MHMGPRRTRPTGRQARIAAKEALLPGRPSHQLWVSAAWCAGSPVQIAHFGLHASMIRGWLLLL